MMFHKLLRSALAVTLIAAASLAQSRSETVPVTSTDPAVQSMVAQVSTQNLVNDETFVYYVAEASGYSFGQGVWAYMDSYSFTALGYTDSGFIFSLEPEQFPWGAYSSQLGDVLFTVTY